MDIRLAAFDLDDTLLNEERIIVPSAREALRRLMERGIKVALATGRHFRTAGGYSRELELNGPVICYNGAMVRWADAEQPQFVSYLDEDMIREVAALCRERGLYLQMYDEQDNIVVERITEKTLADPDFYTTGCVEAGDLSALSAYHTPKMMIFDEPQRIDELNIELEGRYGGRLHLAQSKDYLLEMMNPGVHKGAALQRLAESLGLGPEQVLACGDNSNDAEMLRWAGCGCAVANSPPAVQAAADFVCSLPREQGVLEAIGKFVLGDQ